ncbi:VanW family protein [Nocardia cyriacigeorgica]|uniref:VanW family protein n=1 Tax=Nocardia cyriacigeorgica TaxID=135487 RepID=UPI0024554FFF|nr:VanW family protein [Nocardia cyriacigeorgica]
MTGESNTGRGDRPEPARRAQPTNSGLRQFLESARAQQQQQRREAAQAQQPHETQQSLGDHRPPQHQDSPDATGLNHATPPPPDNPRAGNDNPRIGSAPSPQDYATQRLPVPPNHAAPSTEPLRETARAATPNEPHGHDIGDLDDPQPTTRFAPITGDRPPHSAPPPESDAQAPLRGLASAGPDPVRTQHIRVPNGSADADGQQHDLFTAAAPSSTNNPQSTLRFAPDAAQNTQRMALTPAEQDSLRHQGAEPTRPTQSAPDSFGSEPTGAPRPPAPRGPGERRPISRSSEEPKKGHEFRQVLRSPKARKIGIAAGAVLGLGLLGYVADLAMSSGEVPRGVVVAGVDIGGMDKAAADARLRAELDGRADREIPVTIGDVQTTLVPGDAGLGVDWDGTWDRIGGQPLNPITRLTSLFGTETVEVDSAVDEQALGATLDELRVHDRPTVEGAIVFENAQPVAVAPVPGRVLDVAAARGVLVDDWVAGTSMNLPVVPAPVAVRQDAIDQALHQIAQPAVSGPVVFDGKGGKAVLAPEQIAAIVSFAPDGNGGLTPRIDQKVATDLLAPQLKESEVEPKDATFTLTGSKPTVVPSVVGDKINWPKTLEPLSTLLAASGPQRTAAAVYERVEPKLTTAAADALGIVEPMGEFTTGGFSGPSGVNIRTVARKVDGAVVKPGDTFSLNEFTGPRGTAEGYVESGIIDHGRPSTAVGGGISQFATTLYNAAYFAGLEDAGHTEHSYYISRYPAAREATVFDGAIDLSFRNNTPNGIYIEASANGSQVTVRIWGTKTVEVESITGERTKPTEPKTITLPKGDECIATEGADGFTVSDTRVITDIATGREVSRTTRTVKYDPIPIVKCE